MANERERLKQVLASYGADPARWPEADRHLAKGRGEAKEAADIDRLLDRASPITISPNAQDRLLERVRILSPPGNVSAFPKRPNRQLWVPATALAASLALGIFIGTQDAFEDVLSFGPTASADDAMALTGLDDAEDALEGDQP